MAVGREGRVWVQLSRPGERIEGVERRAAEPGGVPPERWREPVVYDVFEPDGTYLGQVEMPTGFRTYPEPVFDGDRIWAIVVDDLEVQYLTRFRVRGGDARLAGERGSIGMSAR